MSQAPDPDKDPPLLGEEAPVTMPVLPLSLTLTAPDQFKALGDPVRDRILSIIQNEPATAKQIADRLGASPGAIGHHLQVLEAAGLAKVVARRLVRGIVAKYYTRTARIFNFDGAYGLPGATPFGMDMLTKARNEVAETYKAYGENGYLGGGLPHSRLSAKRAMYFERRMRALADEFVDEPQDPDGHIFGLAVSLFLAPPYMQHNPPEGVFQKQATSPTATDEPDEDAGEE
ncbi:MAG: ArsR/SmtB family transcription factor [Ktedonobacterales bacterium]